jgi:hypothetical protein
MANENPDNPPGARRPRPPTVIDLPATEVSPEAKEASEVPASPPSDPPPAPSGGKPEQPANRRSSGIVGGAFGGAIGGLLVAGLLWWLGAFPARQGLPADPGPRLAAIEKQLKDFAARPLPAAVDAKEITKEVNKAVDEVGARVSRLEAAQAAPRAPVTDPVVLGRLTSVEGASKSVADNVAALSRRAEATDAAIRDANTAIQSTNANIAKLAVTLGEVRATARAAAAGSDSASRLALAASMLRDAAQRGEPFLAELAVAKPLTTEVDAIAALEPFAASGVPGNAALGQQLVAIIRPMLGAAETAPTATTGGFWKKLRTSAQTLVRISPADGKVTGGNERDAILTRAEQRATQGNVAGAGEELSKLPADAHAPFQAWTARVDARNKALDASRRLAAGAVAALKAEP